MGEKASETREESGGNHICRSTKYKHKKKNTGKTIYNNIKRKQNHFLIDFSFATSEAKHLLLPY